jgi:hypothetical protein
MVTSHGLDLVIQPVAFGAKRFERRVVRTVTLGPVLQAARGGFQAVERLV